MPTVAAAAAPAMATTSAATPAAFALRTRFIYNQRAAEKVFSVERSDRLFGFGIVANFRKAESARLPRKAILEQGERIRLDSDFRKQRLHLLFGSLEREIPHVQFLHGCSPCARRVPQGTPFRG